MDNITGRNMANEGTKSIEYTVGSEIKRNGLGKIRRGFKRWKRTYRKDVRFSAGRT